ncbi:MAG: DUF3795 domain-containing protein [Desulfobaccales bacterium]
MKESYCDLCDHCDLDSPELQEALGRVQSAMDRMPAFWRRQCLETDFPRFEFHRGLNWLQGRSDCPGCKNHGGLERCAIRRCAEDRGQSHCYECPDYDSCQHLIFV